MRSIDPGKIAQKIFYRLYKEYQPQKKTQFWLAGYPSVFATNIIIWLIIENKEDNLAFPGSYPIFFSH